MYPPQCSIQHSVISSSHSPLFSLPLPTLMSMLCPNLLNLPIGLPSFPRHVQLFMPYFPSHLGVHVTSCHIISCPSPFPPWLPCHVILCLLPFPTSIPMSRHFMFSSPFHFGVHVTSCHIISCHLPFPTSVSMSCHVMSFHVFSPFPPQYPCHVISCPLPSPTSIPMSCHFMFSLLFPLCFHVMSFHVLSHLGVHVVAGGFAQIDGAESKVDGSHFGSGQRVSAQMQLMQLMESISAISVMVRRKAIYVTTSMLQHACVHSNATDAADGKRKRHLCNGEEKNHLRYYRWACVRYS